jgi:hypothetical protein
MVGRKRGHPGTSIFKNGERRRFSLHHNLKFYRAMPLFPKPGRRKCLRAAFLFDPRKWPPGHVARLKNVALSRVALTKPPGQSLKMWPEGNLKVQRVSAAIVSATAPPAGTGGLHSRHPPLSANGESRVVKTCVSLGKFDPSCQLSQLA